MNPGIGVALLENAELSLETEASPKTRPSLNGTEE